MTLTKIFTGMEKGPEAIDANFNDIGNRIPDVGQYYTKSEVDSKITSTDTGDTGWVPVSLLNGWTGSISVRLKDGVVYHKGYFNGNTRGSGANLTVFKYPDNFGDMSAIDGGWICYGYYGSDINVHYVSIHGYTKEFLGGVRSSKDRINVSGIVFKL